MTSADAARQVPWVRYALLAAVFSALWVVISLFASSTGASADEQEPSGLLGAVGSVVGGVTEVTDTAGDTLGVVVDTVVAPAGEVLQPVVESAPAPVAEAVPEVVETTTDAANGTLAAGNVALGTVVNGLTAPLSDMAGSGTVGGVAAPVTGLLDGVVGSVPVVGGLLGDDTLGGVVAPVAGLVDGTLGAVVGSTGELPTDGTGVLPQLPAIPLFPGGSDDEVPGVPAAPGLPGDGSGSTAAASSPSGSDLPPPSSRSSLPYERAATIDGTASSPGGALQTGGGVPASPAAPSGGGTGSGGAGAGGAGGASGTSDAAFAAFGLDALASLVLNSVDDDLPSSPVYDTDTTPD